MKHDTYLTLYKAHLGNVDQKALVHAQGQEPDPFLQHVINLILETDPLLIEWNNDPFTHQFRSGSARERLDETVFTFVLRLVAINKEEHYIRAFRKPESFVVAMAWEAIFRRLLLCSLALLYDVRWTAQSICQFLDPTVLELLSGGSATALRKLFASLGITVARQDAYPAERDFAKLNHLHVNQYSAFYWRYLHWMAEACDLRRDPEMQIYKVLWLELVTESLYRTLRCGYCMIHFRNLLQQFGPRLVDTATDLPRVWFEIHNKVHAQRRETVPFLKEPDYTESEFEEDRAFMHQGLSP